MNTARRLLAVVLATAACLVMASVSAVSGCREQVRIVIGNGQGPGQPGGVLLPAPNPPAVPAPSPPPGVAPGATGVTDMVTHQWVANQSGSAGGRYYRIVVPPQTVSLTFETQGGTGNCCLYVRRGAPPTHQLHQWGSAWAGTVQKATINNPPAGAYYAWLEGRPAFQGVLIRAHHARFHMMNPGSAPP